MSAIRRLSDTDVRAIFESVHGNHLPPPNLSFQVVRVGPKGLKLSPPSFQFADGLYVFLKPAKTNCPIPRVPPHLLDCVANDLGDDSCPWSLSGPQFPQPTAIQQRYCYPKGNFDYSSQKGGALWTMYDSSGKEDLDFRLLHVYYSPKRAGTLSATPSPARRRRHVTTPPSSTPARVPKRAATTSPWPPPSWNPHHTGAYRTMMHHHQHHPPPPQYLPPASYPPHRGGGHPHYHHHHHPYAVAHEQQQQYYKRPRLLPAPPSASKTMNHVLIAPPPNEDDDVWMTIPATTNLKSQDLLEEDKTISAKFSFEFLPLDEHSGLFDSFLLNDNGDDDDTGLQKLLDGMEQQLLEWIEAQPSKEQLYKVVREWASQLVVEEQSTNKTRTAQV